MITGTVGRNFGTKTQCVRVHVALVDETNTGVDHVIQDGFRRVEFGEEVPSWVILVEVGTGLAVLAGAPAACGGVMFIIALRVVVITIIIAMSVAAGKRGER